MTDDCLHPEYPKIKGISPFRENPCDQREKCRFGMDSFRAQNYVPF